MSEKTNKPFNQDLHSHSLVSASETRQVKAEVPRGVSELADEDTARAIFHERRHGRDMKRDARRKRTGNWLLGTAVVTALLAGIGVGAHRINTHDKKHKQANNPIDVRPLPPVGANLAPGLHSANAIRLQTSVHRK